MSYGDSVLPSPVAQAYLSHTRVSTYADCGMKAKLTYIDQVPKEPQGALLGGIAVHNTIDALEKEQLMLDEPTFLVGQKADLTFAVEFLRVIDEEGGGDPTTIHWSGPKSKTFPQGHDLEWWKLFGPGMVRRAHLVRLADQAVGLEVVDTEMEVNAYLPSGTRFTTRIDQLLSTRYEAGEQAYFIRDWKTSSRTRAASRLQNVLYGYAVRQTLGIDVARGQVIYLAMAETKVDDFEMEALTPVALEWVSEVERGLDQGLYVMNPGSYCSSCSVRTACPWGSTLEEASRA